MMRLPHKRRSPATCNFKARPARATRTRPGCWSPQSFSMSSSAFVPLAGLRRRPPAVLRRCLHEIDERTQRCGHQAASGVVEERTGEALPPRFEYGFELAADEVRAQPVLEQIDHADAGHRCLDHEIGSTADADQQRPSRIDPHHLAVALEFPGRDRPAGEAAAQTGMTEKLARVPGPAAAIE